MKKPPEGRYSNVSRRVWGDEKFCSLSAPKPNAQTLWLRLLTGPELGNVPGLFAARQRGLAEALGWSDAAFRRCWEEISNANMAFADWSAGIVWVPKSLDHNPPHSTNVVLSWKLSLKELPESNLKAQAMASIGARVESMGEAWAKAWVKATEKVCVIQEQDQEQEQEIPPESPPLGKAPKPPRKSGRRSPKIPIPLDWQPNDTHRVKASKLGLNLDSEAEKFRNNAEGKDVRWVDWDKAFHNWLSNGATFASNRNGGAPGAVLHEANQAAEDARRLDQAKRGLWGPRAQAQALDGTINLKKLADHVRANGGKPTHAESTRPAAERSSHLANESPPVSVGAIASLVSGIGRAIP